MSFLVLFLLKKVRGLAFKRGKSFSTFASFCPQKRIKSLEKVTCHSADVQVCPILPGGNGLEMWTGHLHQGYGTSVARPIKTEDAERRNPGQSGAVSGKIKPWP
jgi:hypothetical protein